MGIEKEARVCLECREIVHVERGAYVDRSKVGFATACPRCGGEQLEPFFTVNHRPVHPDTEAPSFGQGLRDHVMRGVEPEPNDAPTGTCPKCGSTMSIESVGIWD